MLFWYVFLDLLPTKGAQSVVGLIAKSWEAAHSRGGEGSGFMGAAVCTENVALQP